MRYRDDLEAAGRVADRAERLGGPVIWMQRSEITSGFVNAAIAFVNRAVAAGKPFYVNLWPDDVHSPFFPVSAVTGAGLKALNELPDLQTLHLTNTQVGDAGLEHLKPLTQLRYLLLEGTKATKVGVAALQKHLPKCNIYLRLP